MPFFAALMVSWPTCLCFKHNVVDQNPGILIVPSLFVFIPGDSITMQAVEVMEGYWSSGVSRLFYSIMMLVMAAAGALLGAGITGLSESALDPGDYTQTFPWWAIYPGRVAYAVGTLLTFNGYARDIPVTAIITLATGGIAQGIARLVGEDFGTLVASILGVTILSALAARKPDRPPAYVYMAAPFFTLTPYVQRLIATYWMCL